MPLTKRTKIILAAGICIAAGVAIWFLIRSQSPSPSPDPTPDCDPSNPMCNTSVIPGQDPNSKKDPNDPNGTATYKFPVGTFVIFKDTRGSYINPGDSFDGRVYNQDTAKTAWMLSLSRDGTSYVIMDARPDHPGELLVMVDPTTPGVAKFDSDTKGDDSAQWIISVVDNGKKLVTMMNKKTKSYLGGNVGSPDNNMYGYVSLIASSSSTSNTTSSTSSSSSSSSSNTTSSTSSTSSSSTGTIADATKYTILIAPKNLLDAKQQQLQSLYLAAVNGASIDGKLPNGKLPNGKLPMDDTNSGSGSDNSDNTQKPPEAIPNFTKTVTKYNNQPVQIHDTNRNLPVFVAGDSSLRNQFNSLPTPAIFSLVSDNLYRIQFVGYTNSYLTDTNNSTLSLTTLTDNSSLWGLYASTVCADSYALWNVSTNKWLGFGTMTPDRIYAYFGDGSTNNINTNMCFTLTPDTSSNYGKSYVPSNTYLSNYNVPAVYTQMGNNTNYIMYTDHRWITINCSPVSLKTPYDYGQAGTARLNKDPQGNLTGYANTCRTADGSQMQGTLIPSPGWTAYQNVQCDNCSNVAQAAYDASWQAPYFEKVKKALVCQPCAPGYEYDGNGGCAINNDASTRVAASNLRAPGSNVPTWDNACAIGQNIVDMSKVNTDQPNCNPCPVGFTYDNRYGMINGQPEQSFCVAQSSDAKDLVRQEFNSSSHPYGTPVPDGLRASQILASVWREFYPSIQPRQRSNGGCY